MKIWYISLILSLFVLPIVTCSGAQNEGTARIHFNEFLNAARNGDKSTVNRLLKSDRTLINMHGQSPKGMPLDPFEIAMANTIVDLKSRTIAFQGKPYDVTALHEAVLGGHKDIMILLLAKGANVNSTDKFGRTPLHYACSFTANIPIITLLLSHHANVKTLQITGILYHQ